MFRLVLIEPEIPQNTGNIARLSVVAGLELVLVGKLGFIIDDKKLRRSGMDYWNEVKLTRFTTIEDYFNTQPNFIAISTKGQTPYTAFEYNKNTQLDLMFGNESSGLPKFIYSQYPDKLYRIPMLANKRSINLSSSVAIVSYHLLHMQNFDGLI